MDGEFCGDMLSAIWYFKYAAQTPVPLPSKHLPGCFSGQEEKMGCRELSSSTAVYRCNCFVVSFYRACPRSMTQPRAAHSGSFLHVMWNCGGGGDAGGWEELGFGIGPSWMAARAVRCVTWGAWSSEPILLPLGREGTVCSRQHCGEDRRSHGHVGATHFPSPLPAASPSPSPSML